MTTNKTTYNGWKNYETWNVGLWLDNDQSTYYMVEEMVQDAVNNAVPYKQRYHRESKYITLRDCAKFYLADIIKDFIEENSPVVTGLYADLLNAAIGEVDWHELADNYLDTFGYTNDDLGIDELA